MCQLNGIGSLKLSSTYWVGTDLGTKESMWQLPRVLMWFKVPQYGCHPESVSPGWSTITTSPLQETPKLASRTGPGSYQIAAFSLGPHASEILCVQFETESLFPKVLWDSWNYALRPSKLDALGLIFLVLESCVQEPEVGLRTLAPAGEPLQYDYSPVWGFPHSGCMGSNDIVILPLLPISLSFPPYVFIYRRSILVFSHLFHWLFLCK